MQHSNPSIEKKIFMNDNPLESHHFVRIYSKPFEYAIFFFVIKMIRLIDTNENHSMDLTANINRCVLSTINKNATRQCPMYFNPFIRFERPAFIDDKVIRAIDLELMA